MTNTQIMELLHNKAINQQTKKVLYITIGVIAVGSIAAYYYQKDQRTRNGILQSTHQNFVHFSEARINGLTQIVKEKDSIIVEQAGTIKKQQNEYIIFKNKLNAQPALEEKNV